jgi:phosphonate transport system substrate-binding protein
VRKSLATSNAAIPAASTLSPRRAFLPSSPARLLFFLLLAGTLGKAEPASASASGADSEPERLVRFGLSESLVVDVNESDAQAAMVAYFKAIGDRYTTRIQTRILRGDAALSEAIRRDDVDIYGLTAQEFIAHEKEGLVGPYLFSSAHGEASEEYVLLVREDGLIKQVEDLRGKSLIISSDVRAAMAPFWFEVLFRQHGFSAPKEDLARLTYASKPTQVLLPVFFGKADACILTRNAFQVMGELNPQVAKQLKILAVSKKIVSGLSCFRRNAPEELTRLIADKATMSEKDPAFQQVMALFRTGVIVEQGGAVLQDTRALLATYSELTKPALAQETPQPKTAERKPATPQRRSPKTP